MNATQLIAIIITLLLFAIVWRVADNNDRRIDRMLRRRAEDEVDRGDQRQADVILSPASSHASVIVEGVQPDHGA